MNNRLIDDAILREYLLGRLEVDHELVEYIDEHLLTDSEFSTSVDIVEDDIIEEYLENTLGEAEMRAVERHFLRPPERQERLRTARLIQRHLPAPAPLFITPDTPTRPSRIAIIRTPQLSAWSAIAATVLLAACLFSLWRQHRRINSVELANLQLKDQHHELYARNVPPLVAPYVRLNLLQPGLSRGSNPLPNLDLPASADKVHIEIALSAWSPGPYRIILLHNNATAWTGPSLQANPVHGGSIVRFDMPALALPEGTCAVALKPVSGKDIQYWFNVHRL